MKFNISYPLTGKQKTIEIDDEKRVAFFFDRTIGNEVQGDTLGDDFKGYTFKITGGSDKDGFAMKQGINKKGRVRLMLRKGQSGFRPKRSGERKRKSVRGCIVGADIAVLSLAIVKKGEKEVAGITNESNPRRLGPKRANKIRKLYGLTKKEDVRRYVVRRTITKEGKKAKVKAPKIQRLITAERLRRKRVYRSTRLAKVVKNQKALAEYIKLRADAKKAHAHKHGLEVTGKAILPPTAAPKAADPKAVGKHAPAAGKEVKKDVKAGGAPAKTTAPAPKAAETKKVAAPAHEAKKPAPAAEPKKAAAAADPKKAKK